MPKVIDSFSGEYDWLSNFYPATVRLKRVTYPTLENAYQAAKCRTPEERVVFETCTPGQSKRLARKVVLRSNWDSVRIKVMRYLLRQKFRPGSKLATKLLATGDAMLVEGNWWNDQFWGVCRGVGQNWLGVLLMEQRTYLQRYKRGLT